MTAHTNTKHAGTTAYYLGRPAGFWLTIFAPRPAAHKSPCDPPLGAQRPRHDGTPPVRRASC